jgi:hypothetical protein
MTEKRFRRTLKKLVLKRKGPEDIAEKEETRSSNQSTSVVINETSDF